MNKRTKFIFQSSQDETCIDLFQEVEAKMEKVGKIMHHRVVLMQVSLLSFR